MNVSSFVEIVDSDSYWTEYSDGVNMPGDAKLNELFWIYLHLLISQNIKDMCKFRQV